MKKILIILIFSCFLFNGCQNIHLELNNKAINISVLNYTDIEYQTSKLYIGGVDSSGKFIATDSLAFPEIPSNISPSGSYNDSYCDIPFCSFKSENGYYYHVDNDGEKYVRIPFGIFQNFGELWAPDEERILAISDFAYFKYELNNGQEALFQGFDLTDENSSGTHKLRIKITDTEVSGSVDL